MPKEATQQFGNYLARIINVPVGGVPQRKREKSIILHTLPSNRHLGNILESIIIKVGGEESRESRQ